jgi:phosphoribosylaminoimidazolecarboxamide formyltransferase / IMP cyclohydrolase
MSKPFQLALVSVSNKDGLIEFLKPLVQAGLKIVSTGGTKKYLSENNISVIDVFEVTQFPEVLDGRVKTLHPHIHMGLLADLDLEAHVNQVKEQRVTPFDMVVGNLYPFEDYQDIDHIDIGGPSFLRAGAKNFKHVTVVCDPKDYLWLQEKILQNKVELADRKKLALKVFQLTSYYDSLISTKFAQELNTSDFESEYLNKPMKLKQKLRYGENPQQQASWYYNPMEPNSLAAAEVLQGKELSYNNLLDLNAAVGLVKEYSSLICVAVKHNNPCGVGFGPDIYTCVNNAILADSKSIFGGIVAVNRMLDLKSAERLSELFLECIIAPEFAPESLELFSKKKNLRLLRWKEISTLSKMNELKSIVGGYLQQNQDHFGQRELQIYGQQPTVEILQTIENGEKICGFLKSNAIAILNSNRSVGLGMGQVNRVDAVEQAIFRCKNNLENTKTDGRDLILVSDAFFPFPDSIDLIAEAGIKWVVQPGGSIKDSEVINRAKEKNINLILTGQRHFRH